METMKRENKIKEDNIIDFIVALQTHAIELVKHVNSINKLKFVIIYLESKSR